MTAGLEQELGSHKKQNKNGFTPLYLFQWQLSPSPTCSSDNCSQIPRISSSENCPQVLRTCSNENCLQIPRICSNENCPQVPSTCSSGNCLKVGRFCSSEKCRKAPRTCSNENCLQIPRIYSSEKCPRVHVFVPVNSGIRVPPTVHHPGLVERSPWERRAQSGQTAWSMPFVLVKLMRRQTQTDAVPNTRLTWLPNVRCKRIYAQLIVYMLMISLH